MNLPTFKQIAENIILEKYLSKESHLCLYCNTFLQPREVVVNKNHLYEIGQMWICNCGESRIWTNSIRNEKKFINFLNGKKNAWGEVGYTNGFCNDKFDGYGLIKNIETIKNGISVPGHGQMADLIGIRNSPPNDRIAFWKGKELPDGNTEEIKKWYMEHRADVERLAKTI